LQAFKKWNERALKLAWMNLHRKVGTKQIDQAKYIEKTTSAI
jgi:hypothetical protein